jgi:hypothetical protein
VEKKTDEKVKKVSSHNLLACHPMLSHQPSCLHAHHICNIILKNLFKGSIGRFEGPKSLYGLWSMQSFGLFLKYNDMSAVASNYAIRMSSVPVPRDLVNNSSETRIGH